MKRMVLVVVLGVAALFCAACLKNEPSAPPVTPVPEKETVQTQAVPAPAEPAALAAETPAAPVEPTPAAAKPQPVPAAPAAVPSAAGADTALELRPVADTHIACYPMAGRSAESKDSEMGANAGTTQRLKIKRQENHPLLRFDFAPVPAGVEITSAVLTVTMTEEGKLLNHVCAYSMHVDWNEGEGAWDDAGKVDLNHSGACFLGPKGINSKWREYAESDFGHAALGNGGNAVCVTRARSLGENRFAIDIDPVVIHAAMLDGDTIGLTEETGSWNKPSNGFFYSREADNGLGPVLKLTWRTADDMEPPAFDGPLTAEPGPDPGSILVHLPHAGDDGVQGNAIGYSIMVNGAAVPQVLIPRPAAYHRTAFLKGFDPGTEVDVVVHAFDETGNALSKSVTVNTGPELTAALAPYPGSVTALGAGQTNPAFSLKITDGLTLFDPLTGGLAPKQMRRDGGQAGSVIAAMRGEIIGLQTVISLGADVTDLKDIVVTVTGNGVPLVPDGWVEMFREHFVKVDGVWCADILAPLAAGEAIAIPSQPGIEGQRSAVVYIDLYVPKTTKPGTYTGTVAVTTSAGAASLPIAIEVNDVTLPDELTFVLEMNAYGHSGNVDEFLDMYRLCHKHRLSYNVLGYGHSRPGSQTTPATEGKGKDTRISDWSVYDEFYGPIFTGEAVKDLPRAGAPASHWYAPFHESWPVSLEETDPNRECWEGRVSPNQDKQGFEEWTDRMCAAQKLAADHFSEEWRAGNRAVIKQFVEHFAEKGWTRTSMQFFSNHKFYFSSGSQSLWVMDEPQYGRDFRALDWLYGFYRDNLEGGPMTYALRADISRPGWGGERFDKGLDLSVGYPDWQEAILKDKIKAFGYTQWWYGGGRNADADPAMYAALFLKKYSQGCSGGMPNWTFDAGNKAWDTTDPLRYVTYDSRRKPVPTMRMKACRYGQQLMELMNQAAALPGFNRWHVSDLAQAEVPVKMVTISKGPEDPGYSTFENLDAAALEGLKGRLIATILKGK